jgi:hypothetical protein
MYNKTNVDSNLINILLKGNADPNIEDNDNNTPLMYILQAKQPVNVIISVVESLLKHGAVVTEPLRQMIQQGMIKEEFVRILPQENMSWYINNTLRHQNKAMDKYIKNMQMRYPQNELVQSAVSKKGGKHRKYKKARRTLKRR